MQKRLTTWTTLTILSAGVMLGACNTIRGAGEDLESVGEEISEEAEEVEDNR